jgi:3-oxoacyl-[acyl-carrier protein] reductase
MRFDGRSAIVTGAGSGIGLSIATALLAEGADVALLYHNAHPEVWPGDDEKRLFLRGDIADAAFIEASVAEAAAHFGRLDYVVNAAGIFMVGEDSSIVDIDLDVWARVMAINLMAPVLMTRHAVPHLRASGGGALLHIASAAGVRTLDNLMKDGPADAYQTSKAGLISVSRSLAISLGADNIRSNTICPGSIATPMTDVFYSRPERVAAMEERTPLHRIGTPEEVAAAALFLLSDEARFISGIDLFIDGGLLAKFG